MIFGLQMIGSLVLFICLVSFAVYFITKTLASKDAKINELQENTNEAIDIKKEQTDHANDSLDDVYTRMRNKYTRD